MRALLVEIGRTKAAFLYDQQIRRLGPAAVPPLVAYVQSDESRADPDVRLRAMSFVAEMSTAEQSGLLVSLADDPTPEIARMALFALKRLGARAL